jgi:hypothetical protein
LLLKRNFESEIQTYPPLQRLARSAVLFPGTRKVEEVKVCRVSPKRVGDRMSGALSVASIVPISSKARITQPTEGGLKGKQIRNIKSQRRITT